MGHGPVFRQLTNFMEHPRTVHSQEEKRTARRAILERCQCCVELGNCGFASFQHTEVIFPVISLVSLNAEFQYTASSSLRLEASFGLIDFT